MLGMDRGKKLDDPKFDGNPPRIAIVASVYHADLAENLITQSKSRLSEAFADTELFRVPGALDLAPALSMLTASGIFEGYVILGALCEGENGEDVMFKETLRSISSISSQGYAVGSAVLWAENKKKLVKLGSKRGNLGGAAANAALHLVATQRRLSTAAPASGGNFKPDGTHIIMADDPNANGSQTT